MGNSAYFYLVMLLMFNFCFQEEEKLQNINPRRLKYEVRLMVMSSWSFMLHVNCMMLIHHEVNFLR